MEASAPADAICGTSTGGTNETNFMAMVNAILPSRDADLIAVLIKSRLRLRLRLRRLRLRLRHGLFEVRVVVVERKD